MLVGMSSQNLSLVMSLGKALAARSRALLGVLATLALVGGCGTGGSVVETNQFLFIAIGPDGGTATAGPVRVIIPPGALTQPTGVAILPQATPLPIAPPDGCLYSYVGPIYCCGPVGQPLLVNGVLRMHYEEALIPLGFTESDLVLLEWDNAAAVMRPRSVPPAWQDTVANFFEDPAYDELGHVAIGLRDCRNNQALFDLLLQDGTGNRDKPATGSTQGVTPVVTLFGVDSGGAALPQVVPTGGLVFDDFIPSPNLQRVLLSSRDQSSNQDQLHTVRVDGAGVPILIASDDQPNNTSLQSYDPTYGWLQQGGGEHAYYTQYVSQELIQAEGEDLPPDPEPSQTYEIWRRIGDATAAETLLHASSASEWFLDDIRQSNAGGHLMSDWVSFFQSPSHVDVTQVPAGVPVSVGIVPNSAGSQTPRFFPGSSDLYLVDTNGQEVNRYTAAGAFVDNLFTVFVVTNQIYDRVVDFALAPDGDTFAAVVELDNKGTESVLLMGTLTQGVLATYNFFDQVFVNEMIWHPLLTGVFIDLSGQGVSLYKLNDDDGFYITSTVVPVQGLQDLDVHRIDGRIVILVRGFAFDALQTGLALAPGVYVSPGDASDFQQVPIPGVDNPVLVRWLVTWRHVAGRFSSRVR